MAGLSETQAGEIARHRALWREHSLSTTPADRHGAQEAMRALYRQAGLAEPERIAWCGSPHALIATAARYSGGGREVWHALAGAATEPAWQAVWTELEAETAASVWQQLEGSLWRVYDADRGENRIDGLPGAPEVGQTHALVTASKEIVSLWQCASSREHDWVASQGRYWVLSRWFGDVLPLAAFANEVLELERASSISPLAQLVRCAGPWIARERVAFICERPTVLELEDEGEQLHCADGPALAWPDGTASYFWHGIRVSEQTIMAPETLDADTILSEQNAEVRRVMLERHGLERFLRGGSMQRIDRASDGSALWLASLPDDEDLVLLELVNTTPEPDGSHKHYILRVPPDMRSVRAATAWTFDLDEASYQLTAAS